MEPSTIEELIEANRRRHKHARDIAPLVVHRPEHPEHPPHPQGGQPPPRTIPDPETEKPPQSPRQALEAALGFVRQCLYRGFQGGTRPCKCGFRCWAQFGPYLNGHETTERDCLDCIPRNLKLRGLAHVR